MDPADLVVGVFEGAVGDPCALGFLALLGEGAHQVGGWPASAASRPRRRRSRAGRRRRGAGLDAVPAGPGVDYEPQLASFYRHAVSLQPALVSLRSAETRLAQRAPRWGSAGARQQGSLSSRGTKPGTPAMTTL